jgi:transposase
VPPGPWTREQLLGLCATNPEQVVDLIFALLARVEQLTQRVQDLERQVNQNSRNSSKPPSSDGYGKPAPKSLREKSGKPSGGQPGHPGHRLKMVAEPDHVVQHTPESCRQCGRALAQEASASYQRRQVSDLVVRMEVTEHQAHSVRCPDCGTVNIGAFPTGITQPTQYGPDIKAFITYCDMYQLLPSERVHEMVYDLTGHALSEGTLYNANEKLYGALASYEAQVQEQLRAASVAHFDESGLRVQGKLHWLHSASTVLLTHYTVHARRGQAGIDAGGILPGFTGTAVHDGWSPYRLYTRCRHALCNAHHERELQAVLDNDHQDWARDLREHLHTIKAAVDQAAAAGRISLDEQTRKEFAAGYDAIIRRGLEANPVPERTAPGKRGRAKKTKTRNLLERLDQYRDDVLRFMYDFRVPYTNNQGERDIRMTKVQQKVSGTFRSLDGAKIFCRIRGYISTVRKHGLPVLQYIRAAFEGHPFMPSA